MGMWTALRRWWDEQGRAWEIFFTAQRPWEQDGPLRWRRGREGDWELQGATVPVHRGSPWDCRW